MKKSLLCAANKGCVLAEIYDYLFPAADTDALRACVLSVECRIKDGQKVVVLKSTKGGRHET